VSEPVKRKLRIDIESGEFDDHFGQAQEYVACDAAIIMAVDGDLRIVGQNSAEVSVAFIALDGWTQSELQSEFQVQTWIEFGKHLAQDRTVPPCIREMMSHAMKRIHNHILEAHSNEGVPESEMN
jgi:hypothetical protein